MADKYEIEGRRREVRFVDWDEASGLDQPDPVRIGVKPMVGELLWMRVGTKSKCAVVVGAKGGTWVWHAGCARFVKDEEGPKRRRARSAELPGAVTPPMPATVVRVLVEVGDTVEQGQSLVVLSAMKMESTLCAPHAGKVKAINAKVGTTVKPGEILVEVVVPPEGLDPDADDLGL